MDYYNIGQRIRTYRKARQLSQEELAEQVGISVTHMSHIETGHTKLSLPVFVQLTKTLQVRAEDLLEEKKEGSVAAQQELAYLLAQCTPQQQHILVDILKAAKIALDKHTP